ncbi:MAG: hypothetical protein QN144_14075, partial [Armatimonadota bacterium]|nr:hypothetical protein [Armatimonadota bacterium]
MQACGLEPGELGHLYKILEHDFIGCSGQLTRHKILKLNNDHWSAKPCWSGWKKGTLRRWW